MAIPDGQRPFFDPAQLDLRADVLLIEACKLMDQADRDDIPDLVSQAAIGMRLDLFRALRQEATRRRRMYAPPGL